MCQVPPRAVPIPRSFNAFAMDARLVTPSACIWCVTGRMFAAKASAAFRFIACPIRCAFARFCGLWFPSSAQKSPQPNRAPHAAEFHGLADVPRRTPPGRGGRLRLRRGEQFASSWLPRAGILPWPLPILGRSTPLTSLWVTAVLSQGGRTATRARRAGTDLLPPSPSAPARRAGDNVAGPGAEFRRRAMQVNRAEPRIGSRRHAFCSGC